MNFWRVVWALARKDVVAELRTRRMLAQTVFFALLVLLIFNFAFELNSGLIQAVAPGILWVTISFAGLLELNRTFLSEPEPGGIEGLLLAPVDRAALYLGKMLGNLVFLVVMEAICLPLFALFYQVNLWPATGELVVVLGLGSLGFAALGTLIAAMTARSAAREWLLPLLLIPLVLPVIIAATKITGTVLAGGHLGEAAAWMRLLVVFDLIYLVLGTITFEYVIEE